MARHALRRRPILADVNRTVVWGAVLLGGQALTVVVGVQLLSSGNADGVAVWMVGTVVIAMVVGYWSGGAGHAESTENHVQGSATTGDLSGRMAGAVPPELSGLPPADGAEAEDHEQPGAGALVRARFVRHVVHGLPDETSSYLAARAPAVGRHRAA